MRHRDKAGTEGVLGVKIGARLFAA